MIVVMALLAAIVAYLLRGKAAKARVVMASDDRFIQVGSEIVIANLGQSKPFVTFPGGNGSETQKVYDNTLLVVLFSVSDAGSTETLYLNQKEKTFRLVEDIGSIPDLKTMIIDGKLKLS